MTVLPTKKYIIIMIVTAVLLSLIAIIALHSWL